jgi:hypothetical protein
MICSCETEYIDVYSELMDADANLIESALSGRYCGTISPHVRISLHHVLVIVLHSRARTRRDELKFHGTYQFIPSSRYLYNTNYNVSI